MIDLNNRLPTFKKALVFIPHPDDEAIGCGALLASLSALGCTVEVVLVSNGDGAGELPEGTSERRVSELQRSLSQLGISNPPELWMEADGQLEKSTGLGLRIAERLQRADADVVISPWFGDQHPDHKTVGDCVRAAGFNTSVTTCIFYEVWTPLPANAILDATGVWNQKTAALAEHKTALACGDYMHAMNGLAAYRSLFLPHTGQTCRYAEAFLLIESSTTPVRISDPVPMSLGRLIRQFFGAK